MAKKENNELANRNQAFLIYQDDNGIARVNVRFEGEDVWLTQEQMMELFDASQQDVSYHIGQIYEEEEQDPERTHKKFLLVRQEGNRSVRRQISHYNLDMIIAVGYRVKSQVATRFRQWATARLREFIQKGFVQTLFSSQILRATSVFNSSLMVKRCGPHRSELPKFSKWKFLLSTIT